MSINIKKDHISRNAPHNRRPEYKLNPTSITMHSTANVKATAQNERDWLMNKSNRRTASFHYVVDDSEIIEAIPPDEVAWHAGDGTLSKGGNMTSLSIEISESGNRSKAIANALKLCAYLMHKHNITKVVRHYDWTRKICPRIFHDYGTWSGWKSFKNDLKREYNGSGGGASVEATGGSKNVYIVQSGDTLSGIADKHGVDVEDLMKLNPQIEDENEIYPEQRIALNRKVYIVQKGDYLSKIAQKVKVKMEDILEMNPQVKDPDVIEVGQILQLEKDKPPERKKRTLPDVVLQRGDKGKNVELLQDALNDVYFKVGAVDGSFGPKTEDAVKRFQSVYTPDMVDGSFGPKTRAALIKKLNE